MSDDELIYIPDEIIKDYEMSEEEQERERKERDKQSEEAFKKLGID